MLLRAPSDLSLGKSSGTVISLLLLFEGSPCCQDWCTIHLSHAIVFVLLHTQRNPFDVLKTLSQTNQGKSIPLGTLVGQMYQDQGIKGFYRGVNVNIMRAIVLNASKMAVYDISKGQVVQTTGWTRKDPRTAFFSSFVAGFFMTCTVVSGCEGGSIVAIFACICWPCFSATDYLLFLTLCVSLAPSSIFFTTCRLLLIAYEPSS